MDWIGWTTDGQAWIALLSLTALEIVLGIDNIVFISVLSQRLPEEQQPRARNLGLGLALAGRVVLLLSIAWIMRLDDPLFALFGHAFSGRDLILAGGGLFLLYKATKEIHQSLEGDAGHDQGSVRKATFGSVLTQILLLDLVFSLDSVITAVGMADHVPVMILAVVLAIGVMLLTAKSVADFIHRHPTVKMLALSFLLLVGVALIADGLGLHIPRGYIYFAMGFSVLIELLNMRVRKVRNPVGLRKRQV